MDVFKHLRRQAKVLRHHGLGRVLDPFVKQKSRIFGETAIVEDEEELRSVLAQALQRVRVTGRKIPQIAFLEVVYE